MGQDDQLPQQAKLSPRLPDGGAAADQLRRMTDMFKIGEELANLGSWESDPQTGEYWSRNLFVILGLDPEAHSASWDLFISLVPAEDQNLVRERYKKILTEDELLTGYDIRIRRLDGVERILRNTVKSYRSVDGRLLRVIGVAQDITEQLAETAKLRESEHALANAQRIAQIGNWEWDLAAEALTWSDEIYRIFGRDPSVFTPNSTDFLGQIHPDERENFTALIAAASRDKKAFDFQHRIIQLSGAVRTLHQRGEVVYGADGKRLKIIGTSADVTEAKKTADDLARSEHMFHDAERIAKTGSWEADMVTGEIRWSPGMFELSGVDSRDLTLDFSFLLNAMHPDDRPMMTSLIAAVGAGDDRQTSADFRIIGPDGSEKIIYGLVRFVRDQSQNIVRLIGTNRDVTEERAAAKALRAALEDAQQANRSKTEFLANMSHELRTPLNAIIGFAEILAKDTRKPARTDLDREYAADIRDSGLHLLDIINDILDFSRLEAGQSDRDDERIETRWLLDWVVRLLQVKAEAKGLKISVDVAPDADEFTGDLRLLRQAVLNILSNAVKFTQSGEISLKAERRNDGAISISVTDTGIGMRAEEIPVALTPFAQIASALQRNNEGVGLGLPLAKRFAELHGGSLHIASEPGKGTTVTIEIPADRVGPAIQVGA